MYLKNLYYIFQHKYYVFIECMKIGLYLHAFTHDLSKLLPSEFKAYARWFHTPEGTVYIGRNTKLEFNVAWNHHQNRNKHHWNYWVKACGEAVPMPKKYVKQMVADWRAMGRRFGDTANSYYHRSKSEMILHPETIENINEVFGGNYGQEKTNNRNTPT